MRSLSRRLPSPNCVLITGAGWSYAAGLPLANELFDPAGGVPPRDWSDRAVIDAYEHWRRENVGHPAEQFIAYAYAGHAKFMEAPLRPKPFPSRTGQLELALDLEDEQWHERRVGWSQVAAYIQRRLAVPAAELGSIGTIRIDLPCCDARSARHRLTSGTPCWSARLSVPSSP